MSRHYLDHASTSPIRPVVLGAMQAWFLGAASAPGDPGRIHAEGMAARVAVEQAREEVAACFGARAREVVFTSGATESITSAVWGSAPRGSELVVPTIEHSAVREAARLVAELGGHRVIEVGVDHRGRIDPDAVAAAITGDTALVNVQWANHEVGTRQPVREIVQACREREVLVHVDAAVGAGHDLVDFGDLGADLLSISGHKFGGPPGIGLLLIRRGLRIRPLLRGGDQERARRAGLENVPAIVGLAAACRSLDPDSIEAEAATAQRLTDRVLALADTIDRVRVYGDRVDRAPHLVCLGVEGVEPQAVLLGLDQAGIAAHSGSACSSESLEPSPVLEAMGVDAHRSLRISTGWSTTDADIDALGEALPRVISQLRSLGR